MRKSPTRRRLGWAAAGLAVLASAGAGGHVLYSRLHPQMQFVTVPAVRADLTVSVSAAGTLQPSNEVDVGTEVSGRVDQVLVDDNDRVKAGQLLALINTDTARAQLAQYQAALVQAGASLATNRATVQQAETRRARYRNLAADGAISLQDVQAAEADYERAAASVTQARGLMQAAQAQISNSETQIGKAQIRAPIDGIVLARKVSPGQTVAASFNTPTLFTLASDLSSMRLLVDIDEADIGMVREGQTASFLVDAFPNRRFSARLVALRNAPHASNGIVTYPAVLTLDNEAGLLRPGLTATAEILVKVVRHALTVPNGALRFTPPAGTVPRPPPTPQPPNGKVGGRVWVKGKDGPEPRDVLIGSTDGRATEIVAGSLRAGEAVLTDIRTKRT